MADGMPTGEPGSVVLTLDDVSTSFGAIAALRGARLELRAGGAHALGERRRQVDPGGDRGRGAQVGEVVGDRSVTASPLRAPDHPAAYAGAALSAGQVTGADGDLVLGDPTESTADDIDEFDF